MDTPRWRVQSHVIPAAHTRGTSRGIRPGSRPLRLAVKQYTSADEVSYGVCSLTLIVAHGIGASKESFEPFFDELASSGAPVRAIWMADAVHNGESYELNKDSLGDETDWLDYSRDVYQMINYFQDEIQQPLVGIGHSLGAGVLGYLAAWHPRLFNGIVMLEPGLGPGMSYTWPAPQRYYPGLVAMRRRDFWPTREEAAKELRKTRYYKNYDPRAFDNVVRYELRDVDPSGSTNAPSEGGVALVTPKAMEMSMWVVPDPPLPGFKRRNDLDYPAEHTTVLPGIRRPEAYRLFEALTKLFCPILYVWGTNSLSDEKRQELYLKGTAIEWSERTGNITSRTVDCGHMMPQEDPAGTASVVTGWLGYQYKKAQEERAEASLEPSFVKGVHPAVLERFSKL